jgi:Phage integrase family
MMRSVLRAAAVWLALSVLAFAAGTLPFALQQHQNGRPIQCLLNIYQVGTTATPQQIYFDFGPACLRCSHRPDSHVLARRRHCVEQGLSSHVFMTERDGPMTPKAFHALFGRIGARAKMQFPIHPHMLRHGCGFALANAGHDTRALQAWLGHKNIQHTVRYTELAPDRFKDFWR